jgi:hypothetical protein
MDEMDVWQGLVEENQIDRSKCLKWKIGLNKNKNHCLANPVFGRLIYFSVVSVYVQASESDDAP